MEKKINKFNIFYCSDKNTVGVFWHNAAETWVDIGNSKDTNVVSSIVNLVSGHKPENTVDAHFMSESGVFDLFVLMGPTPKDAVKQYASLTGVAPLPQVPKRAEVVIVDSNPSLFSTSRWGIISVGGTTTTKTT
jgi:hypothetical protein